MVSYALETTVQMKEFLTAHDRQSDPVLPDGNCLFQALSKQMTGNSSKHAKLWNILTTFICNSSQLFGRGWTILDCTLSEHFDIVTNVGQYGSHASLSQTPIYMATGSLAVGKCMWPEATLRDCLHFWVPLRWNRTY